MIFSAHGSHERKELIDFSPWKSAFNTRRGDKLVKIPLKFNWYLSLHDEEALLLSKRTRSKAVCIFQKMMDVARGNRSLVYSLRSYASSTQ
jgi:hypothetical protein